MASPTTGAVPFNGNRFFAIMWFIGAAVFFYFLGEFTLPEEMIGVREWGLIASLVGLVSCLAWAALRPLREFLTPKGLRLLDAVSRGTEKLRKRLSGGAGNDGAASS
ncbi:hypothetical protein [Streptomyces cyaneofuscatus]|uniref:hypothetical protein n=1 Tax=Streptomyces cyaneofuscatus TaxID=66883 RepID=UPI003328ED9C